MKNRAHHVSQAKLTRDAARATLQRRLDQVKVDLAARGVGGRVADRISEEAVEALDYTLEVARDSKGIIAGTLAALVLWLFRNPIIDWAEDLLDRDG